ncbi:diguanylate cyclase [Arcobacter sp. LA11]|uniref:diguanylate cyclase n=1 Tax=Arcobacter sp. LA11 TaxID=1898176 RepID=UPI0009355201|nr:diguanylate cyclase [Arcobacter sp. LA11]
MVQTVYDICIKDVVKISNDKTLFDVIELMSKTNLRTIVVEDKKNKRYYIVTTTKLLEFKIANINKKTILKDLPINESKALDKNLNLLTVLNYIDFSEEYMVITEFGKLLGIISYTDIVNNIDPQLLMERQTISSLIHQYKAITTDKHSSTIQAIEIMRQNSCDAIIITNKKRHPIGIFTTKDFIDIIHLDKDLSKPIKKYMTSPVDTLPDDTTISKALDFIKEKHYKRIVVVDEEKRVSGIITQKELLRIVYNKWIELIKEEGSKMSKTNEKLIQTTTELKQKISLDYLTKLINRNKFEELLDKEIERFKIDNHYLFSILIIDIDNFKSINDSFGHLFGDHILQEVARTLTLSSRETDIVARWGGEEFVVILPNTNLEKAAITAEKIRISILNQHFEKINNLTCSFGVAHFHNSDSKIDFFKRADEALYRAKALGKNRVELEHL